MIRTACPAVRLGLQVLRSMFVPLRVLSTDLRRDSWSHGGNTFFFWFFCMSQLLTLYHAAKLVVCCPFVAL